MKNLILSFLVCFPAVLFAQGVSECGTPSAPGSCCYDCTCYTCGDVFNCQNQIGATPSLCQLGGCENCLEGPTTGCATWTENYYLGADDGCVPIDGGLGFLIAGGLGMGVLGVRRRKELELEA